jgi:hypothetical protein
MLYKNKIKVQNILKSAVALMLMLTLSLSTALSPLAKAEEARHTWKTLTSMPAHRIGEIYISPDGSKLFALESDTAHNTNFWMSADDGATWRKIFSKQINLEHAVFSADGSKMVLGNLGTSYFYISTDGGQSWVERVDPVHSTVLISPDGSFLVSCSGSGATGFTTHISTDDGQTWTQKGTNNVSCVGYASNNGAMIAQGNNGDLAKSTDYGQTWTETPGVLNYGRPHSYSNNGNNIFDGDKISLDGGNHWTPSNAPIPAGYIAYQTGISDDGKKLFVTTRSNTGASPNPTTLLTSVDGGRTWHSENGANDYDMMAMSSDGSKMFYMYDTVFRVGTLPTSQPVTPGSGAGGAVAPSTGSTSATPGQKPGKASGRLAETGTSTWTVGGLAVVAVAAGALVLRKRL